MDIVAATSYQLTGPLAVEKVLYQARQPFTKAPGIRVQPILQQKQTAVKYLLAMSERHARSFLHLMGIPEAWWYRSAVAGSSPSV